MEVLITKEQYLNKTNLYDESMRRLQELELIYIQIQNRMKKYPEGKIRIKKNKNKMQNYLRKDAKDKSGVYLSKKEEKKIKIYLQKKYDMEVLKSVDEEIKNLKRFIEKGPKNIQIQNVYSECAKEIKEHILPIDITDKDFIEEWLAKPYEKKEISDDMPMYITEKGERVRSKSELNIANILYNMNIPYKYECPLVLSSGYVIHPDFTILDIRRRCEVYWEHRGMMDDEGYLKHTMQRIKDYIREGIMVGDRLIITEESSFMPLGTDEIKKIVRIIYEK